VEIDPEHVQVMGEWFHLCHRLGVPLVEATDMAEKLGTALAAPGRHYHTLGHVSDCLELLGEANLKESDLAVAELAVWFHDVVYDPGRGDNEGRSAQLAEQWLAAQGIETDEVVAIIEMTAGHALPEGAGDAMRAVHDVDLAILGVTPDEYQAYAAAIREEYSHLSDVEYRAGRIAVLDRIAGAEPIYVLARFRAVLEEQARANIAAEIERLS
jgi:predicted metal-dependent HD superfamily phosphohydrolase